MLKTASADRIRDGSASRAFAVRTACAGHDEQALEPGRRVEALRVAVRAQHEAAQQRGRDVVRVALEPGRLGQQVGAELEDRVGRDQPGDDRRRARPEPARERDVGADRELEVVGRVQRGEPAHDQVAAVARDPQVGVDGEAAGLDDVDLHVQVQRRAHHVEPRPEVGRGRGDADGPAAGSLQDGLLDRRDVRLAGHDRAGLARARSAGP